MDIKARYKHTKYGTMMFNLCASWTKFIIKHKILYYILSSTWGIITTFIGLLTYLAVVVLKFYMPNITINNYLWVYKITIGPKYWGGCTLGLLFLMDHSSIHSISSHEFGHTFQECLFGPLCIFLILIPSAIRYWYREIRSTLKKDNGAYDSIWFEDAATQCGKYAEYYLNK